MTYLTKLFSSILLLASVASFGQISGNTSVTQGTTHTYTFDDGSTHVAKNASVWFATGGTVQSESVSGTQYSVTIQWGTGSIGYVNFQEFQRSGPLGPGNQTIATLQVTLNQPPPAAPPAIQIVSADQCLDAVIRAPGSPPSGVEWFWITNYSNFLSGGDPGAVNASSDLTVTSSNTYHLASRYSGGGQWNYVTSSLYVAVYPSSVGGTMSSSTNAKCGTGTVNFSLSGHVGTIDWWRYRYKNGSGGWNGWTTITNTDNVISVNPTLTQWSDGTRTYQVQAEVQSGDCSAAYPLKQVTIDAPAVAGTISSNSSTQCSLGSVNFSLSGHEGTITRWQYQTQVVGGSWSGWTTITETDNQTSVSSGMPFTNSQMTYRVRATVESGVCTTVYATKDITVHPQPGLPTASAPGTVCVGSNVTFTTNSSYNQWYTSSTGGSPIHTGATYDQVLNATTTLYVQGFNQYGCTKYTRVPVTVNVDLLPVGGTVGGGTEEFGVASGALDLSGYTSTIDKWQYRTTGGWTDISNTSTSLNYVNVLETTEYRVQVDNGVCDPTYSASATVTVLDIPTVDLGISQSIRPAQATTLSASSGHSSYEWFRNNVSVQDSSSNEYSATRPGTYKVTVTSSGGATYTTGDAIISNQMEGINENMVTTYTYRVPVTDIDDPFLYNTSEQSIAAQIYDGLGRAKQSVALMVSPNEKDIVVPVEYDSLGRQTKSYLPYVDTDLTKVSKANALADQSGYYLTSTHATDKAYGETRFEASPLNRPLEQGAPGAAWQIGQNTVTYAYDIADSAEVLRFASETLLTDAKQVYGPGEVYKNTTTDEDGNQTVEYTNKKGQTILKKSQVDVSTWAETYYIYNKQGLLSAVIPPEATSRLDTAFFQSGADRTGFLNTWAFQYAYDNRDRMIMKKVPGAEKVLMVYDQWDRLVLTQDGNQRDSSIWLFTKYDKWNRPIVTGLMTGGTEAQERANVAAATTRFDSFLTSGINEYSNNAYPNSGIDNYLTVTYYDNYDWDNTGLAFTNPAGLTMDTLVRGQVTGTLTKTGNGSWIKSVSYYDDRYRVIQTQSTNHLGGADIVTNYYDFIGQVTSSVSSHDNGADTTTVTRSFTYDHAGRLLETYHQMNDGPNVLLNRNAYNELGELIEKDLHINGSSFIRFDSLQFTGYHGNDMTPNNWSVEDYTVTLERGNTWKKYPLDYNIQSNTVLEFEYKSDHEGEIHGIGFDNDNSMTTGDAYKLHGTQSISLYGAYSYSVGSGWQKFVIPVGQNFSGQKAYITFFADDDVASDAEAIFRNVRLYEEGEEEQSLDYTYNIRGWLTSMNQADLSGGDGDLFGMELYYNTNPLESNNTNFNGNIAAMQWSNYDAAEGVTDERAYNFGYDKLNRLEAADHYQTVSASLTDVNNYSVSGLSYDLNGNIEGLVRKGASGADMDNLSYTYTNGNQLTRVADAASDTTGFHDKHTGSIDYEYDANGNMVKDRNKGIDKIYYNHLNLPTTVILSNSEGSQDSITYLYDAAGIKLSQSVYDSGVLVKKTDYVGEFIYETDTSGTPELQLIQHEEGRIVPVIASDSEAISSFDYQYHLKDHLGNVRMTFSTTPESYETVQNMESLGNNMTDPEEETDFVNIPYRIDDYASTSGNEVATLKPDSTGVMIFFEVNRGDTVNFSVQANYVEQTSTTYNLANIAGGAILSGYNNAVDPLNELPTALSGGVNDGVDAMLNTNALTKNSTNDAPLAYINYLYFSKDMTLHKAGFSQISTAARGLNAHELVTLNVGNSAEIDGYILAYLSNETQQAIDVNFDDFTIYHGKTNVVSTQDYYPFGLTFNESVRVASTEQRFKYNGKEYLPEVGLLDYGARFYNAELGIFHSIDPKAEAYDFQSPYAYAANNPIIFVDKNGEGPEAKNNAKHQLIESGIAKLGNTTFGRYPDGYRQTGREVIFTQGAVDASTSTSTGKVNFNASEGANSVSELLTSVPLREATSVVEVQESASVEFNTNDLGVTTATLTSTTTTTVAEFSGNNLDVTQSSTTISTVYNVSENADGQTTLGHAVKGSTTVNSTDPKSVKLANTSGKFRGLVGKAASFNQNVNSKRSKLSPDIGGTQSIQQDFWEYTFRSEETMSKIHE